EFIEEVGEVSGVVIAEAFFKHRERVGERSHSYIAWPRRINAQSLVIGNTYGSVVAHVSQGADQAMPWHSHDRQPASGVRRHRHLPLCGGRARRHIDEFLGFIQRDGADRWVRRERSPYLLEGAI